MRDKTVQKHVCTVWITSTGKYILDGAFFMHDTVGLPLSMQIELAEQDGRGVVSIPAFVRDAVAAGWTLERVAREVWSELRMLGRLEEARMVRAVVERMDVTKLSQWLEREARVLVENAS